MQTKIDSEKTLFELFLLMDARVNRLLEFFTAEELERLEEELLAIISIAQLGLAQLENSSG